MEFSSSPMALSRSDVVPASPGFKPKNAIYVSDSDDEADELQISVPESSPYFTQATQIVNRTTLQPAPARLTSSSPKTEIEVPVSSPIPPRKPINMAGGRIASMMAPAGTFFRQPRPDPIQKRDTSKRKYESDDELEEPIYVADSSDDDRPARGDIRPSSFKPRQTTPPAVPKLQAEKQTLSVRTVQAKPVAEARLQHLAKKMQTSLRNEYSFEACKKALQAKGLNMGEAINFLRSNPVGKQGNTLQPSIAKAFAKASSDATRNSSVTSSPASSQSSSRSASSSRTSQAPSTPSPQPVKTRGRLQRGLKPRNSPRSSQVEVAQKSSHRTELIDLVSEDELDDELDHDAYSSEPEPSSQDSSAVLAGSNGDSRILEYLETCTVESLMAITKMKASEKDRAEAMVKNRPYQSLDEARAVSHLKSAGKAKGKRSRVAVGETIVDKLTQFVETLDAIGQVVDMCDKKGTRINNTLSNWNVDRSGRKQSSKALVDLPFPREPKPMQGMCTLQPYQLFGMNWLWQLYTQKFGCILADDMGLGKTCQVIAFVSLLVENYKAGIVKGEQPWPVLIVVPPSTLANWEAEFDKFSSGLDLITYSGSQQERNEIAYEIRESPKDYHVVLTSYSQLGRHEDISAMRHIRPHVAVFDEAHKLKTPTANIYRQLIRIEADWKLFLTGTPVQNNIMEMVALLNFINPHLFSNHLEALEDLFQHRASLQEVSQGAVLQDDRVSRARSILEPFILQRKKEEVLTTLPAKTRSVAYCDLFDNQKSIYQEYEGNYRREVRRAIGRLNGRSDDQNNPWMQLRKAAIHGQLFRRYFTDKMVEDMGKTLMKCVPQSRLMQEDLAKLIQELKGESDFHLHLWCRDEPCIASYDVPANSWMESGKVQKLLELIRKFEKNGDRVLVFSKFVMVLEILEECLASAKIKYRILKGDTRVDERQDIIDDFNEDSSIPVFLLTTGAGGTGINLTSANKVIIFDQSDNPQDDIQAENRAHRFGQTRAVEIIRLLTKGTIEELVHMACQRKLELAGKITGYAEDISSKAIEAEVREMFNKKDQGDSP